MLNTKEVVGLIELVVKIRPECEPNLKFKVWIAKRICTDFPEADFNHLREYFETKLAYSDCVITVPTIMFWVRSAALEWTDKKKQERDNYFKTNPQN